MIWIRKCIDFYQYYGVFNQQIYLMQIRGYVKLRMIKSSNIVKRLTVR